MLQKPYFIHTAVVPAITRALTLLFDVGEFQGKVSVINLHMDKIPEMWSLHLYIYTLLCIHNSACYLLMKLQEGEQGTWGGFLMSWKLKSIKYINVILAYAIISW